MKILEKIYENYVFFLKIYENIIKIYEYFLPSNTYLNTFQSGILRYCGPTEFASGVWAGIELEEPAGKNDGSVSGIPYFRCSPKYGTFSGSV